MADAETAKAERTPTTLGFSPGHLCSFAGIIRVLNIVRFMHMGKPSLFLNNSTADIAMFNEMIFLIS
jgi:hypothetical protein